jgi:hypothetical protein
MAFLLNPKKQPIEAAPAPAAAAPTAATATTATAVAAASAQQLPAAAPTDTKTAATALSTEQDLKSFGSQLYQMYTENGDFVETMITDLEKNCLLDSLQNARPIILDWVDQAKKNIAEEKPYHEPSVEEFFDDCHLGWQPPEIITTFENFVDKIKNFVAHIAAYKKLAEQGLSAINLKELTLLEGIPKFLEHHQKAATEHRKKLSPVAAYGMGIGLTPALAPVSTSAAPTPPPAPTAAAASTTPAPAARPLFN